MGEAAPTYTIRTLQDLLKVPDDRLDDCLTELAMYIRIQRGMHSVFDAIAESQGVAGMVGLEMEETFEWIDDGEGRVDIHLTDPAGDEVLHIEGRIA